MNRRDLFRHASTGAAVWTAASYSRVLGANDRVKLGVIGCGGRGSYVMGVFQKNPAVDVVAVCDVWECSCGGQRPSVRGDLAVQRPSHFCYPESCRG